MRGGWIDPSLLHAGSVSWEIRLHRDLQSEPFAMQRNYREMSLITLDAPTWVKSGGTAVSFYDEVILPLVKLRKKPKEENNLRMARNHVQILRKQAICVLQPIQTRSTNPERCPKIRCPRYSLSA